MYHSQAVIDAFKQREKEILRLIEESGVQYEELGTFGSYARGDYKATSDIDFVMITNNRPSREISGDLREKMEGLGADLVFVSPDYFKEDTSLFARNIRRDYRRLL